MIVESVEIFKPVVVLASWTLVMLGWTLVTRLPAMSAKGIRLSRLVGGKGSDADGVLPDRAQWKAHNYNHLLEQPTLFYVIALVLAFSGMGGGVNAAIAWGYVLLRIAHSLVQATFNRVAVRFALFVASTACLVTLTVRAVLVVWQQ